jgi:hypothetical protein
MGPLTQTLVGYDLRETFLPPDALWSGERRRDYLLRREVAKPLAVDTAVWPSLFGEGLPPQERERLCIDEVQLPQWRGPHQALWDDLEAMRAAGARIKDAPHWVVCVSWVSADGSSELQRPSRLGAGLVKGDLAEGQWRLLGFDVADTDLFSGLTNCAYRAAERPALEAAWGPHLNEFHLFREAEAAFAFRDVADKRVPEHAPFVVFALHREESAGRPRNS